MLVVDRKTMNLPTFMTSSPNVMEIDLREYISKKLKASLICYLGSFQSGSDTCPVILIDEPDFLPPPKTWWVITEKFLADSQESDFFRAAYTKILLKGHTLAGPFSVWPMGENELDSAILGQMVACGKKTASTSLLVEYTKGDVVLPKKGNESVIIDWSGRVLCTIRTTDVKIESFGRVDESHAAKEMLGDGSLAYWQDVYWDLFDQICKGFNDEADEKMDIVCESFEVTRSYL